METTLWKFRIFRAHHHYSDAAQLKFEKHLTNSNGTASRLTIGKVPPEYIDASLMADRILEMAVRAADQPEEQGDAPSEWVARGELYTCACVSQEVEVENSERSGQDYFWYDIDDAANKVGKFRHLARETLDALTGQLLGAQPPGLIDATLHDSRIFISGLRKPSQPLLQFRMGNPRVAATHRTELLDLTALYNLQSIEGKESKPYEAIGRWFTLALGETDPFKRFMWAFAGIEVTAETAERSLRAELLTHLTEGGRVEKSIVSELIWPKPREESRDPWRSLLYKFTAMTLVLAPERATADVAIFKDVQSFRNRIHGRKIDEQTVEHHADAAIALLRNYGPALARRLSGDNQDV